MNRHLAHLALALSLAPLAAAATSAFPEAERNYDTYCVQCHGVHRNGKGVNAAHMSVQPRDHTDSKAMNDVPNDEMFKAIKEGGLAVNKSILMPVWGKVLRDDEIHQLVDYLREICKCGT